MPELAAALNGYSALHGDCVNPLSSKHSTGGSSSGTAVAIAAGFVTCGLGTDTGGSTRLPAEHCGISGFRPSLGRYPGDGIIPLDLSMDTAGPMGVTVKDCALLDSALVGENKLY